MDIGSDIKLVIESCKTTVDENSIISYIQEINNWDDFISLAYSHGVFPLVYQTLKSYNNHISTLVLTNMKQINMNIVKLNMLMSNELVKIISVFDENGIIGIPFKGPTLSQIIYENITLRQYCDLDILIENKDFDKTILLLNECGYKSKVNYTMAKEKIIESIADHNFFNKEKGITIEIHNKLFSSSFPVKINTFSFCQNKKELFINKKSINTFSLEYLIVYLCLHGIKHLFSRISWISDIDRIASNVDLKWDLIEKIANEYNCEKIVYTSLLLSMYLFETKLPKDIEDKLDSNHKILAKLIIRNKKDMDVDDKFSYIHFLMFDNFRQKLSYLFYSFKPTYLDYQVLKKEYKSEIIYYMIRPFNLIGKLFKKK